MRTDIPFNTAWWEMEQARKGDEREKRLLTHNSTSDWSAWGAATCC